MGKQTNFKMLRAYPSWARWKKLLLWGCLCALLAVAALAVHGGYERRQSEMHDFFLQCQGVQWTRGQDTADRAITVTAEGQKSAGGAFQGSISVTAGGETLYQVDDCLLYPYPSESEGVYYLCDWDPIIQENQETGIYHITNGDGTVDTRSLLGYVADHAHALLFVDRQWSGLLFMELLETHATGSVLCAAPAENLDEAAALAQRLAAQSAWKDDTWTARSVADGN